MAHRTVAVIIASCLVWSGAAAADEKPIAEQIVDAMNKVFGVHKGFRANHAKGIVVEGSFKATPEAVALSKAVLFNGSDIPLTARFSDGSGVSNIPDGIPDANPHGIAMKFHLPDGSDSDLVINALKFFPVSNPTDFRDLFHRREPARCSQAHENRAIHCRAPQYPRGQCRRSYARQLRS